MSVSARSNRSRERCRGGFIRNTASRYDGAASAPAEHRPSDRLRNSADRLSLPGMQVADPSVVGKGPIIARQRLSAKPTSSIDLIGVRGQDQEERIWAHSAWAHRKDQCKSLFRKFLNHKNPL